MVVEQLFRTAAAVRSGKALHPRGAVVPATVVRHGLSPRTGVGWVDEPGEDRALVRLSRGAGLPPPLPDVLGLALRVTSPAGEPWDLLLASTGEGVLGRRLPQPRRWPGAFCSSVAAFTTPGGPLLVGAKERGGRWLLAVARPRGTWRPFAELVLHADPRTADDEPLTFEPVRHAVPGLGFSRRWRRVREPGYAGSREGRGQAGS
ncbi:hypothetical protein [Kineococcus sp. SYSU DK006]|uniref:hypothetical protein n=1 Tax=Kineococcus sp. SYSU DK006 TaxID=3383127 RepID=UPI003D7DC48E